MQRKLKVLREFMNLTQIILLVFHLAFEVLLLYLMFFVELDDEGVNPVNQFIYYTFGISTICLFLWIP